MQFKRAWKQVDGVLLLDKPLGWTSNDALQKAKLVSHFFIALLWGGTPLKVVDDALVIVKRG